MKSQTRIQDEHYTHLLENFMDTQYAEFGLFKNMERVTDPHIQKSGVDIVYHKNFDSLFIDEKFAIDYRQRDLNTYSFELYSGNNKHSMGWFLNPQSRTTHYMLLWFSSDEDISKIYSYTACFVSKEKIKKYLSEQGLEPLDVLNKFRKFWTEHPDGGDNTEFHIETNKFGNIRRIMEVNGLRVIQSLHKEETPINIIIKKEVLLSLADKVMTKHQTMDVQKTISNFTYSSKCPYDGSEISEKAFDMFANKGIICGNLYYKSNEDLSQKKIVNPTHMDRIVLKNKNGKMQTLFVYDSVFAEWVCVSDYFNTERLKKVTSVRTSTYDSHIKHRLKTKTQPLFFHWTDANYNNKFKQTNTVEDGDRMFYNGMFTSGKKNVFVYSSKFKNFLSYSL